MARIRSVHPGIWTDEAFMDLSPFARLLIIGLWTEADDGGAFAWKPKQLKVRILGSDDVNIEALLHELSKQGFILHYSCDGSEFGAIRNFGKFQSPKKPSRKWPMSEEIRQFSATSKIEEETVSQNCEIIKETVPHKFPTSNEPIPTGEEGRGGERRGELPSLRSGPPEPVEAEIMPMEVQAPDARSQLWADGLQRLKYMTGKPDRQLRPLLGKWLKTARDDCGLLLSIIREASELRPADAVSWVTQAVASRTGHAADRIRSEFQMPTMSLAEMDAQAAALGEEICR
ncbi:hypothetical protein [Acetobacter orientalis]|uniref:Phage related protein n=1 Tax=Acetobacter orientalis TaxID=146474 RepID=A0A0D6NNA6_9PROT|nr:hypothetical protein [Acetobacter orientalis]GAN66886.1 phage related protein [Acetobacter orientalis]GBR14343.1 putative phage-related protein [Acetobacter orientalis NRIC 0481]GEL60869.1 hypothetical protein AOR02nite_07110 [Acetobacter orientalis]